MSVSNMPNDPAYVERVYVRLQSSEWKDNCIATLQQELTEARAEIERLNKMRTHCENCGGDYMATGLEAGCPCLLKAENERLRKPVTVRCSYCGEIICTEAEWNAKVPDHMANCAKNPVNVLALENVRLKAPVTEEEWHRFAVQGEFLVDGVVVLLQPFLSVVGATRMIAARAVGGKG